MLNWKKYTIGDLLQLEYGKSLTDYRSGIGKNDVFGTNGKIGKTDKCLFQEPSVIIGRKGAYREVHFAKNPFFVIDTAFYTKKRNEKTDTVFMYYWFKNVDINAMDSGSAIPSTSRDEVYELDILLPSIDEQNSIASTLLGLDDKIDLLHRQNKTLEQLAETLFRQWFVVEADERWEEGTLHDLTDHLKEGINPMKFPDTNFFHYSLPTFDEGKTPKKEFGKTILSNKYKVVPNSILISKLNPRFPRVWEIMEDVLPENSVCSTEFQIVRPKNKEHLEFVCCFLKSSRVTSELSSASGGTSGSHQRVNPDDIFNLTLQIPPQDILSRFHTKSNAFFQKIKSNTTQIRTLTQLRDTLLPKLMSGEVRVNS